MYCTYYLRTLSQVTKSDSCWREHKRSHTTKNSSYALTFATPHVGVTLGLPVAPRLPVLKLDSSNKGRVSSCYFSHKSYDWYGSTWLKYSSPNQSVGPGKWANLIDQAWISHALLEQVWNQVHLEYVGWGQMPPEQRGHSQKSKWVPINKGSRHLQYLCSFTIDIRARYIICGTQFKMKI